MPIVIITITEEGTEVAFQSDDDINVCIFDLTSDDLYLHNEQTCRITGVNDDGTINIKYIGSSHRVRYNVPASEVVLYYCEEDDIDSEVD